MTSKRPLAALLLAAFAVLGILRVPCLFGAALRSQAADVPPCHGAPAADDERPVSCSQCASLHGLVGPASGIAALDAASAVLWVGAPAWRSLTARRAASTLWRVGAAPGPDPFRSSAVRLL